MLERSAKIEALAAEMGVSAQDLTSFVNCLSIWTCKGYSLEEAIEKHMAQMKRFVAGALDLAHSEVGRQIVANTFFN